MCQECQHDLQIAIDFRRVCIEAQELLNLQLQQEKKEEEAFESLAEQWLNEEECSSNSSDPQDNGKVKSEILKHTQDRDASKTISVVSIEPVIIQPASKVEHLPKKSPGVQPELPAKRRLSDDLPFSAGPQSPQEIEAVDDLDSSSHSCSKCGLDFDNLDELRTHKYHLHDVPQNTKFVCDHCSEGFRSAAALRKHCQMIELPETHECTKCKLKFHNQILLETHEERCKKPPETHHVCHLCGKRLTTAFNLKNHLVRHAGTRPHKCDKCDATFSAAAELSSHRKTHTSERPYACRYDCGKTFRFCSARSMHERIHMDASKRIYQCEYCPKSFVTPSDCRTHQKYHNLTRDHSCDTCRISFKQLKHYQAHLKSNAHKTLEARARAVKK
ncbi:zinc finger protein 664 isoform X2 [Drosophila rhopaloa]|nr:zinc finger protein 664 isoform X2 [Drosophila rhopaloa]